MNYDVGDLVKVALKEVKDEAGVLRDPDGVVFKLRSPSGETLPERFWPEGTVERESIGSFWTTFLVSESGVWLYEWETSGGVELTEAGEIVVREDQLDAAKPAPFAVPWRPDTADVAALIHARTIVAGGNRVGDFTAATEPTGEQVERLINLAVRTVASGAGADPSTADLRADARAVAAYLAAALVEQSYWPEQSISAQSTFAALMKLAETNLGTLETRVDEVCGSGSGEGEEGEEEVAGGAVAAGSFDDGVEIYSRTYPPRW